jgi:TIR domain
MTANHVEHEIATFPGSPGRPGLKREGASGNDGMIASMGQKFFISFNSADRDKAHWIAWTLMEAGHEVAVYDWEIPAGGNVPLWMSTKLAWDDRLIAVISPDYVPSRYSPMEWTSPDLERSRRDERLGHPGHCQANIQNAVKRYILGFCAMYDFHSGRFVLMGDDRYNYDREET